MVDSLRQVQSFLQNNTSAGNSALGKVGYTEQLNNLQARSDQQAYINQLIDRRISSLKRIASTSQAGGFSNLDKTAFYGKSRINAFKEMAEEPSKAEDQALEYLQGQKGFSSYLKNSSGMASLPDNASGSDLRKVGYQTKQQVSEQLQQKFGSGLPAIQQKMGGQVKDFQDKLSKVRTAANTVKQTKQSAKQLTAVRTPSFKVNAERAKPFWQRIERQFNWQTSRANVSGSQPAMLQLSAMAGFKNTPKLSYGLGIATSIGLGNGWNDVHLSFEGIGLRSYAAWKWQFGIGAYAGYERMYKLAAFIGQKDAIEASEQNPHNRTNYNESVLIGLTKTYRMNDKWNGSLQVLYDIWWKEKNLKSPIVLRFATIKI